jgi:hypothetical protein
MNPNYVYGPSRAQVTALRLASWRQVVKAVACPACAAEVGKACRLGQVDDCANCGRLSACATGTRLHRARLDLWLRPQVAR